MGKINVLGFDVANLIAAGEVVDRPASVVKELMENSVDAGAKNITVEIQHGGSSLIRVSDNGCGMSPEDLPVSILRHATSKIHSAGDLDSISTLGFRGEALAATAAVSRLRILTRTAGASMGSLLEAEGGEHVILSDSGCAQGTTIVVEDLFFNVPARRKFLKKDATETAAVTSVVEKVALSVPEVAIKYIVDGQMKFLTAGNGRLDSTIYSLYGRELAKRLLYVDRTDHDIRVSGYISEADFVRSNRNMENFFINGRFVKSHTAAAALEQAYLSKSQADKFPFCVLSLEMNPGMVDVNVHPSKLEVKFSNERLIFDAVYYTVLGALETSVQRPDLSLTGSVSPKIAPEKPDTSRSAFPSASSKPGTAFVTGEEAKKIYQSFVPKDGKGEYATGKKDQISLSREKPKEPSPVAEAPCRKEPAGAAEQKSPPIPSDFRRPEEKAVREPSAPETFLPEKKEAAETESAQPIPEYLILGEAYNCYVLVQLEDRLLVVDKHAAHERILFDRLCENRRNKEKQSQILMFPLELSLTSEETASLFAFRSEVESLGFRIQDQTGKVSVGEIPADLTREQAEEMLVTFAGRLADGSGAAESMRVEFFEKTLWQAACKAAIKGGRIYREEHLRWIIDRILQPAGPGGSVIKTCPHGRPVAFEIKKSSLERQFARLQ